MKRKVYQGVAAILATLLLSTTAFADDAKKIDDDTKMLEIQTQTTLPENALTLDMAVEMAKTNSIDLRSSSDQAEYLQKLKEDIWDITGSFSVPSVSYQQWVDPEIYGIYSSIQNISSNMTKNKYSEELTKLTLEASVKNQFTSILSDESALAWKKKDTELKKKLYEQGMLKNELGVLSDYELQNLYSDYQQAEFDTVKLEMALQQEYASFYQLIGAEKNAVYTLVYDVTYQPYTMTQTLDQYVTNKLNTDYTIKLQEQAVSDAKFGKNYLPWTSTGGETAGKEYSFAEAQRSLKTTKENKELAIRNAHNTITQLESQYEAAQATLKQSQAAYRAAEVNVRAGNATTITLDKAALAVEQAENALRQLEYAHDMQIYQFENTELLAGATPRMSK